MSVLLDKKFIVSLLQERNTLGHKYSFGKLLVLGGSASYPGAPVLTTLAAYRTGCGLVTLACPSSCIPAVVEISKETTYLPLPEKTEELLASLPNFSAVVLGPGLGRSVDTQGLLNRIVLEIAVPTVLDADGLFWLAERQYALPATCSWILTPHEGEMAALLNTTAREVTSSREEHALQCAKLFYATVVLKGPQTIIATAEGQIWKNSTGSINLATAGTGDVLAGIIGSLLAQGYSPEDASCLGVYLHGAAGDVWKSQHGDRGMLASDLITLLPDAYVALQKN